jgi:hypothetical protein
MSWVRFATSSPMARGEGHMLAAFIGTRRSEKANWRRTISQ